MLVRKQLQHSVGPYLQRVFDSVARGPGFRSRFGTLYVTPVRRVDR